MINSRVFGALVLLVAVLTAPFYYIYFDLIAFERELARIERYEQALERAPLYRATLGSRCS